MLKQAEFSFQSFCSDTAGFNISLSDDKFWRKPLSIKRISKETLVSEFHRTREAVEYTYLLEKDLERELDLHRNGVRAASLSERLEQCREEQAIIRDRFYDIQAEIKRREKRYHEVFNL